MRKRRPVCNDLTLLVGILWILKNDKLVVSGFSAGSVANRVGIEIGDILKAIDGREVLHLQTYDNVCCDVSLVLRYGMVH